LNEALEAPDWSFLRLTPADSKLFFALFSVAYCVLVYLGHVLREHHGSLAIIWPSAGLLFFALCVTSPRSWIWLIAIQWFSEVLINYLLLKQFDLRWATALFPTANSIDAIVGATIARGFILAAVLPRIQQLPVFLAAAGVGASASALFGAFGAVHVMADISYLHQWQLWWAGNWLGSLTIAPVAMNWAVRFRLPAFAAPPARPLEVWVTGLILLAMTAWIFTATPAGVATILQLPIVLLALLIVAAFRLPPRWSTTFAAGVVLLAAWFSSRGLGPFEADPNVFERVGRLQIFLAALVIITYMLATVLLEKRRMFDRLTLSDERYRQFVSHSSEAVWRIELVEPMPMGLPVSEQIGWLKQHARVAECNLSYKHFHQAQTRPTDDMSQWNADVPWSAIYVEHLEEAARQEYSLDGMRFELTIGNEHEVYLATFSGIVEDGKLARIWGVARNITQLADLNERLRREQERLQAYARQLVGAEERARRAAAVKLEEGIEQRLINMKATLEAVSAQAPAGLRLVHDELRQTLDDISEHARQLISDLSPPGLYDLGLGAALQWLAVYMRTHSNLQVGVQIDVRESALNLELRILAFQVIRELLRNVAKHAGVETAEVEVTASERELLVKVSDAGVGFEWQYDLFVEQSRGFGLLSISDRVHSAQGQFSVDTAPGKGCRVSITFPVILNVEEPLRPPLPPSKWRRDERATTPIYRGGST